MNALKLKQGEAFPDNGAEQGRKRELGPIVATYPYHDAEGKVAFRVTRHEPKAFRLEWPDGKGGWAGERGGRPINSRNQRRHRRWSCS